MFSFGATAAEVRTLHATMDYRKPLMDVRLREVLDEILKGRFGNIEDSSFGTIVASLQPGSDRFMVGHDFGAYLETNEAIDALYGVDEACRGEWIRRSIEACACMGHFSSDRCIHEYSEKVWHMEPHQFKPPAPTATNKNGGDEG